MTYKKKHKKCIHSWHPLGRVLNYDLKKPKIKIKFQYCPNCIRIWESGASGLLSLEEFKVRADILAKQGNPIRDFKHNEPVLINI